MDQNVDTHTNGSQAVAGTNINGAGQTGSNITVVGLGGTITKGTKITLPGVFAVNPQSRVSTGTLAQFTVTADVAAGATVHPDLAGDRGHGCVPERVRRPTTGAPFTIFGTVSAATPTTSLPQGRVHAGDGADVGSPGGKGVIDVAQESYDGFTVKVTEFYDGVNDNSSCASTCCSGGRRRTPSSRSASRCKTRRGCGLCPSNHPTRSFYEIVARQRDRPRRSQGARASLRRVRRW
jgi:hypothetical protein